MVRFSLGLAPGQRDPDVTRTRQRVDARDIFRGQLEPWLIHSVAQAIRVLALALALGDKATQLPE
jgi:hypothetical protein